MFKIFRKNPGSTSETILHDSFFEELRNKEYKHIVDNNHVYLDYTGGGMYAYSQIVEHLKMLESNTYGNPHSTNPTSVLSTKLVEETRAAILKHFNAEDYYCIFTSNATGALKIIGECYPFTANSKFLLLADNHNSVNGIREYCKGKGGSFEYSLIQYEDLMINEEQLERQLLDEAIRDNKLFAFPAQSNVSGVKHDLKWIKKAQNAGWDVLLDAAAFVPSSKLDLIQHPADFVSISFYKIFGYPTGLGCLLVKKSKFNKLVKPWFAGGTVTLVAVQSPQHFLAENHERYENGTLNYLSIPAIKIGLDHVNSIGMQMINERVMSLTHYLYMQLKALKHSNGKPLVHVFGPADRSKAGPNMILNIFDQDGHMIPFEWVENQANKLKISIRSGCFCNPGIDEVNSCISNDELTRYFTSRSSGNYHDMVTELKKMRGAIRVSVGIASSKEDLDTFLSFVDQYKDHSLEELSVNL